MCNIRKNRRKIGIYKILNRVTGDFYIGSASWSLNDRLSRHKKVLEVTFKNGKTYEYKDVSETDYLFFKEAKSHGKFLHSNINGKFKSKLKEEKKKKDK